MTSKNLSDPKYLLLGKIERPHGVRGEIRMRIYTDFPERVHAGQSLYLGPDPDGEALPYTVETVRPHQNYLLIKFSEINERTDADLLRNLFVMVEHDQAVPLEDDEIYLYQLIGLTVHTTEGQILGEIVDVLETGANDVYVIRRPDSKDLLFPAHDETVIEIDLDEQTIIVQPPEGLLDA